MLLNIGGLVAAHSVKLLDRINNPGTIRQTGRQKDLLYFVNFNAIQMNQRQGTPGGMR
jgi:hypothetical protein